MGHQVNDPTAEAREVAEEWERQGAIAGYRKGLVIPLLSDLLRARDERIAALHEDIEQLIGERDRQYEFNVEQIAKQAELETALTLAREVADERIAAQAEELSWRRKKAEQSEAALTLAREVLREHEWDAYNETSGHPEDGHLCHECGQRQSEGHAPDCRWARAVGK